MSRNDMPLPIPQGWMCPKCCKILSPSVQEHECVGVHIFSSEATHGCTACRGGVCGCYRPELGPWAK